MRPMARDDVGKHREVPVHVARPTYGGQPNVGKVVPIADTHRNSRLVYLDEVGIRSLFEQIVAGQGRSLLGTPAPVASNGVLASFNSWALLPRVVDAVRENDFLDLGDRRPVLDLDEIHPGQAVGLTGVVTSAKEITPGGFSMVSAGHVLRILVDRSQVLHLNQAYMSARVATVLGRVHSVSRKQIRAFVVAVGPLEPT
jgi:hypothetical protein